jgi:hypothetical protein
LFTASLPNKFGDYGGWQMSLVGHSDPEFGIRNPTLEPESKNSRLFFTFK